MGCVLQDSDALVSQGRKSQGNPMHKVLEPIQRVRFTESTLRHASIQEKKGPSCGKNVKLPHQRSPYAVKLWGQISRRDWTTAAMWPKQGLGSCSNIFTLREKDKIAFYSPSEEWVPPVTSTKESGEREFVVDSRASMHMVNEKDIHFAELETMRTSRSPTTVMTANGEVQTRQ